MKKIFRLSPYTILWIVLPFATFVLLKVFKFYPGFIENVYFGVFFQWVRIVYDHTIGFLPFPVIYLIFIFIIILIIRWFRQFFWQRTGKPGESLFQLGFKVLALAGCLITLFYWLWGFNYMRPTFEDLFKLEVTELTEDELYEDLYWVTDRMSRMRNAISPDTTALDAGFVPDNLENLIRDELEEFLRLLEIPVYGRARVRKIRPKGVLLRFSTAGIYIPHAIEGHIDAGLHPLTWPYTMTHEMFHAYGFTDEGTCELLAFLAGRDHENPFIRYSAYMGYWRYLLSNARRSNPHRYVEYLETVPASLILDLRAISAYSNRYRDLMPKLRDLIYDNYLKSHGIKEGMASYSRIILLVRAWNRRMEGNENDNGNTSK